MFIKNLNLYLEITYIVRQENIIPQGFFLVFGGSIPNFSRKCKSDFNKNIISGRARFKVSLVRNQRISYVTPMRRYKMQRTMPLSSTWIESHDQTTQLMCNLRKISAKCKPYGIKHVFVSSLLYT